MPFKYQNILIFSSICLLSACADTNMGSLSGPKYVPRLTVPESQYTEQNYREDAMDTIRYLQYEQREQCQHYRAIPRRMTLVNCQLVPAPNPAPSVVTYPLPSTPAEPPRLLPIVNSYTIYFDFDRSVIRPSEQTTLNRVAQEIKQYNPAQITVTGHTDTSGPADYNQRLSKRRADSVVKALSQRGINSEVVDESARGEFDLAVPTGDGVKLEENRRAVIDFRR